MSKLTATSAIVLAGGRSSRMGCDKAALPLGEGRLIDGLLGKLREIFATIIVVGAAPGIVCDPRVRLVADERPGLGPLMGLLSGLKASDSELNFVMACDIPAFDRDFLLRMLSRAEAYDILVPRHRNGFHEPLFAVYSRRIVSLIQTSLDSGLTRIDLIYPLCRQGYIELEDDSWLVNINTPQDYARFAAQVIHNSHIDHD